MSESKPGPHQPVGATTTDEARGLVAFEEHVEKRRTGRRLALIAVGVAVVLLTTFCGTGVVVNSERGRQRALWLNFEAMRAEYDCCYSEQTLGQCADAIADLETLYAVQQAAPSRAARLAAWFERTIGLEPMAWDVRTPDPGEIAETRARCVVLRADLAAPDRINPRVIVASGDALRLHDSAVSDVRAALEHKDPELVAAGVVAVASALERCRSEAMGAAMVPTSGGTLPDGAASTLHGALLCLRRLAPLVDVARAGATRERAFFLRAARSADPGASRAAWALTLLEEPDGDADVAAVETLVGAAGIGNARSMPFLEDAVGRALARWPASSVQHARSVLEAAGANAVPRLRLLRALARVPSERAFACDALAQSVIDSARAESDGGVWGHETFAMPPLCASALPLMDAALPVPNQWGSHFVAQHMGKLGIEALPVVLRAQDKIPDHNPLAKSTLAQAAQQAVDRDFALRVGMSPLVYGHPEATQGVDRPAITDGPCKGDPRFTCARDVKHTADSALLADLFR